MKHIQSIIVFVIICISGFSQETSTVTDPRDGKVYTTVKIGNRWIMSQNLAYRPEKGLFWADTAFFEKDIKAPYVLDRDTAMYKFKNGKAYFAFGYQSDDKSEGKLIVNSDDYYIAVGTLIFDSTKFFAKNLFDGYLVLNSVLFERYGYLYDFETAKASAIPGWHVPTSDEWKELLKNIGGNAKNYVVGGALFQVDLNIVILMNLKEVFGVHPKQDIWEFVWTLTDRPCFDKVLPALDLLISGPD
jgi:hypothetical protein